QAGLEEAETAPRRAVAPGAERTAGLDDDHRALSGMRRQLPGWAHQQTPAHGNRPEVGAPGVGPGLVGERRDLDAGLGAGLGERHQLAQILADSGRSGAGVDGRAEETA